MKRSTKIWIGVGAGVLIAGVLVFAFRNPIKRGLKKTFKGYKWFDTGLKWYRDSKTRAIVENLHPKIVDDFKEFISRVEKELGLQVIATSGYRSWEKQAELHKQNPKNASAGNSSHNYGFALDLNVLDKNGNNILRMATPKSSWENSGIVRIAKDMGFKWGGDFRGYYDPVHFYKEPMSREQMKNLYLAGKKDSKGYIKIS
jgi:hypothetical protein